MAKRPTPSLFGTLRETAEAASAVNGELVRQLRVADLEENPMNRFSMAEDDAYRATMQSIAQDGFYDDILVTPSETPGKYRIVSGHRRVAAARALGKATVPCKVRRYAGRLDELRALMGANLHRRATSPFDLARQLETLRDVLREEGQLAPTVRAQHEQMAEQTGLSRASVERYLDLLNLDATLTDWAEQGKMTMTDAYELARRANVPLYPAIEAFVERAGETDDFPALVHRAIAATRRALTPASPAPKAESDPVTRLSSVDRALRSAAQKLRTRDPSSAAPNAL